MRTALMLAAGLLGALVLGAPARAAVTTDCDGTSLRALPCEATLPPCAEPAEAVEPCLS